MGDDRTEKLNCWLSGYLVARNAEVTQELIIELVHGRIPNDAKGAVEDTVKGNLQMMSEDGTFVGCVTPILGNRLADDIVLAKVAFDDGDLLEAVRHLQNIDGATTSGMFNRQRAKAR